jgi:hypothetical protein
MNIMPKIIKTDERVRMQQLRQKILRRHAQIGGHVFGPIPKGHDRQFFCLDKYTWVWHESWKDRQGQHVVTTRYDVRPNGVFKVQNGGGYQSLSNGEAKNLYEAAELYMHRVTEDYNSRVQPA